MLVQRAVFRHWQGKRLIVSVRILCSCRQQFYAAHKWLPFPSAHVSLPPDSHPQNNSLPRSRPLYAADLAELCDVDLKLVRKKLSNSANASKAVVSIVPDVETLSWHHAREEFVANELYGESPRIKGAIVGNEEGKRVWCVWSCFWYNSDPQNSKGNTMNVLRLVVENIEGVDPSAASEEGVQIAKDSYVSAATASLFAAAQVEADKWHMGTIDIWNPTSATLAAAKKLDNNAHVVHRENDSVASLRWYGEGPAEEICWVDNDKYAWC